MEKAVHQLRGDEGKDYSLFKQRKRHLSNLYLCFVYIEEEVIYWHDKKRIE